MNVSGVSQRERIPPPANESDKLAYMVLTRANMNMTAGQGTTVDGVYINTN